MTDQDRLLDGDASTSERRLLEAARSDFPPRGSRGRALVSLGVGSGLVAVGTTAAAAGTAKVLGAGSTAATGATAATVSAIGLTKWIGIGVLGGTLIAGAATQLEANGPPDPVVQPPTTESVSLAAQMVAKPGPAAAPRATPIDEEPVDPTPASGPSAPTIGDELASLDRAKAELESGDPTEARRLLSAHARAFPEGKLGQEAEVLAIRTALARGDRARTAELARAFLARHAQSPHARHVRSLLTRATQAPRPQGLSVERAGAKDPLPAAETVGPKQQPASVGAFPPAP